MRNKKEIAYAAIISFAIAFMLCLYAPMEIYFTNVAEYWFDAYVLFPVMFVVFLLVGAVGTALFSVVWIFSKKGYSVMICVAFAMYIALYIQGNYCVANLPVFDGNIPDWSAYGTEKMVSFLVFAGSMVLSAVLLWKLRSKRFMKCVAGASIFISLMLLMTGVTLCLTNEGYERKKMMTITTEDMYEMSTDTNFIIFMLDSVDSRTFDSLLEVHGEYANYFEDFTYYSNVVSGYPFTAECVPLIFSGEWYLNEQPLSDFMAHVYGEAPFFAELEEAGYEMGMYSTELEAVNDECLYRFTNVKDSIGKINNYPKFVKLMLKYVGFRYLPYQVKNICFQMITTEFADFQMLPSEEYEICKLYNNEPIFWDLCEPDVISLTDEKIFRFIHTEGAHVPFTFNEYMERVPDATYESSVEASMTITNMYLEHLKKEGVYDNSVIVIMADHGHEDLGLPFPRYNAVLMVKGLGEKKEFSTSAAPISHEDMAEAFHRLLQGADSQSIFDWKEGDERERRHFYYSSGYVEDLRERYVGTDSRDVDAVYSTGLVIERD